MATRSTIAIEFIDGTVEQIYAHWDGYLENNGQILLEHYSDPFKLRELIDQGNVSSLAPSIGTKRPFSNPFSYGTDKYNSFVQQWAGQCVFYGRDRGETGHEASRFKNFRDYKQNAQREEYNYILRNDGVWYVEFHGKYEGPLVEALIKQKLEEA